MNCLTRSLLVSCCTAVWVRSECGLPKATALQGAKSLEQSLEQLNSKQLRDLRDQVSVETAILKCLRSCLMLAYKMQCTYLHSY